MDFEVHNDLLGIISTYTNTRVTLDLFSYFMPNEGYNPLVWKRKALCEGRGLVPNDALVGSVDGGWYVYYLMCNRTFYGTVRKFDIVNGEIDTATGKPSPDAVIFNCTNSFVEINQYPNLSIDMRYYQGVAIPNWVNIPLNRKVRQVSPGASFVDVDSVGCILLLDEYGMVWVKNINSNHVFMLCDVSGVPIVDIVSVARIISNNNTVMLNRYGRLVVLGFQKYGKPAGIYVPNALPPSGAGTTISIHDGYSAISAITSYGKRYDSSEYNKFAFYANKYDPDGLFITLDITTSLRHVLNARFGLRRIVSSAYLTAIITDRSVYTRDTNVAILPGTKGNSQFVMETEHEVIVLIDD